MPAQNKKTGFTLIELLVVIAIIAVLATVGMIAYSSVQKNARISKRIQDLDSFKTAFETYKAANGFYPKAASSAGLCAGSTAANALGAATPALVPTFMQSIPKDPSGPDNATAPCYMYRSDANGLEYKLWISSVAEMSATEFATQPNYLDPARDGGSGACTMDPPGTGTTYTSWAIYSTAGTSTSVPNACAF